MERERKKTTAILLIALGLVSAGLIGYAIFADSRINDYKNQLFNRATSAFEELLEEISSLNVQFSRLDASGDGAYTRELLGDIWRETGEAARIAEDLPLHDESRQQLIAYCNTAGDFARQLAHKLETGGRITDGDRAQIEAIRNTCGQLSQKLMSAWNSGYIADVELDAFIPEGETSAVADLAAQTYPRLEYDGPFSESVRNKEPAGLPAHNVTEQAAASVAQAFVGMDVEATWHNDGDLPVYNFMTEADGQTVRVSVTKQGGAVVYYEKQTPGGLSVLPTEKKADEAQRAAHAFLLAHEFGEMEAGYVQYYDGCAVFNMIPLQEGVLLYPDIIKVWVDMETMEVVRMDAKNYWINHIPRTLEEPAVSAVQAAGSLSDTLTVVEQGRAVIPLSDGSEADCHMFLCRMDAREVIVFIDTQTGEERDILVVVHTNHGTLTK